MADRVREFDYEDVEGLHKTCDRLAELLTQTSIALKGQPPSNVLWSWHDLPEIADRYAGIVRAVASGTVVPPEAAKAALFRCEAE